MRREPVYATRIRLGAGRLCFAGDRQSQVGCRSAKPRLMLVPSPHAAAGLDDGRRPRWSRQLCRREQRGIGRLFEIHTPGIDDHDPVSQAPYGCRSPDSGTAACAG